MDSETAFCPINCPCPCDSNTSHCSHRKPCQFDKRECKSPRIVGYAYNLNNNPDINQEDNNYKMVSQTNLPTKFGIFDVRIYSYKMPSTQFPKISGPPVVLISGDVFGKDNVPVRVHDQCETSEVFGSLKCDCKKQLKFAQKYVQENSGLIIYLHQEGRGIGLSNKIAAYALQEQGYDTVDSNRKLGLEDDYRSYEVVNLEKLGVKIDSLVPVLIEPNQYSANYLKTKATRMGHQLPLDGYSQYRY